MIKHYYKKIISLIFTILVIWIVIWLYQADFGHGKTIDYGVSFSQKYATEMNLNWQEVYLAILDELKVKKIRLAAHWDLIELQKDYYDFSDLDWQISQAQSHGAQVILAIGHRVPRWPECHWPDWSFTLTKEKRQEQVKKLLTKIVNRYKDNQIIAAWQVENEPYLKVFGECPKPDKAFYKKELELVRLLDDRPIVITESGELSTWLRAAKLADYVGASVYRITWNKHFGYFYYPLPPAYYYLKAQIVKAITSVKDIMVSEMQMEPWLGMPVLLTPLNEQYHSMDLPRFRKNLHYIQRAGLSPVYFWGAEWWYWLKEQGDSSIWESAKTIWRQTR